MASFKALNIESDDESDAEIDNTKEIQIEEALKLYQSALKLHSQGQHDVEALKEAVEAYKSLFDSEIFKYPESQSEYSRELLGQQLPLDSRYNNFVPFVDASNVGSAPSTLPQILHLSYKNRGQLHIDKLLASLAREGQNTAQESQRDDYQEVDSLQLKVEVQDALRDFAEALDKDEGDLDLWRRAARTCQVLGVKRLARYCLEAALDKDEEGADAILGLPGIEMHAAANELRELETSVDDEVSMKQPLVWSTDQKPLPRAWTDQIIIYPTLQESAFGRDGDTPSGFASEAKLITIEVEKATWTSLGQGILNRLVSDKEAQTKPPPGSAIRLRLPDPDLENSVEEVNEQDAEVAVQSSSEDVHEQSNDRKDMLTDEWNATTEKKEDEITKIYTSEETLPRPLESPKENNDSNTPTELPTRKRSTEAAELPEAPEGGRVRSKRIRARESIAGEANSAEAKASDFGPELNEKIRASTEADTWLFEAVRNITKKLDLVDPVNPSEVRELVSPAASIKSATESKEIPFRQAILDFYRMMQHWNRSKTKFLLQDPEPAETEATDDNAGLLTFMDDANATVERQSHSRDPPGIMSFVETVNKQWLSIFDVSMLWVKKVLDNNESVQTPNDALSSDTQYHWPDTLKETIMRMTTEIDDGIFDYCLSKTEEQDAMVQACNGESNSDQEALKDIQSTMIQSLFELHLDIYSHATSTTGEDGVSLHKAQFESLNRWYELSRESISLRFQMLPHSTKYDTLTLRHLWACVVYMKLSNQSTRDHVIACIENMKSIWNEQSSSTIHLPNSVAMPELSISAADREISRLETMDFFSSIFQNEKRSPVDLIESLEPILDENIRNAIEDDTEHRDGAHPNGLENGAANVDDYRANSTVQVLSRFLQKASTSLRLSLWDKLRQAYEKIDYAPKVFSISLRNMQIFIGELKRTSLWQSKPEERETHILSTLRKLNENLARAIELAEKHTEVFECIDYEHLTQSVRTVTDLWSILYTVALYDDYSQIGQKGGPLVNPFRVYPSESFHSPSIMLHNMQIQTAILLYKLFSEATNQLPEHFESPMESKLNLLRHFHDAFGVRRLCKASDSLFLRYMKQELMSLPKFDTQTSDDLAQILYDLYDLHCFSSPFVRQSHGCDADYLDRPNALELIDFVMDKTQRVNVKDLVKSDLGRSIEKLHAGLGTVPSSVAASRNRRIYLAYMKNPIDQGLLYRSLAGLVDISITTLNPDEALIASKGWYLLKGKIALAKANAQRSKASSGSAEDLNVASAFFIQDLEYTAEKWETWYRLAQTHDALLEEQVLWSSEKINQEPGELAHTQRTALHAYALATSIFTKTIEPSDETATTIAEIYSEFGNRIYSSTRPPFSMKAFSWKDFPEKNLEANFPDPQVAADSPYNNYRSKPLGEPLAWRLAGTLFKRASRFKPQNWMNYYMLGKTMWKLYQIIPGKIPAESIINPFMQAIERMPERKDYNRQEPTLEPIYKVVSVVYKLVNKNFLDAQSAERAIEDCFHKQKQFDVPKMPALAECEDWDAYVLSLLKLLRAADKSRWHHRLVFRAAHIMYNKHKASGDGARIAKEYLIEQHMYSPKTLAITVWKPDLERPGRHWIYMTSYARFIIRLLEETNDVDALQILARRVRKKVNEFYEHTGLWKYLCEAHVKLHRRYGKIPLTHSDTVFQYVDQEEFAARSTVMDKWLAEQEDSQVLRQVLAETTELKKLNSGLAKTVAMDELLADTYAAIWDEVPTAEKESLKTTQSMHFRNTPEPPPAPPVVERKDMMSLNNLMNIDGSAEPTPEPPPQSAQITLDASARPRSRIVSRREITKRAFDAIVSKPAPKAPASPVKPMPRPLDPSLKVSADGQGTSADEKVDEAGTNTAASSAPGSVHDSADDESELSEPDDDEVEEPITVKSMFPNLKPSSSAPANETEEEEEEEGNVEEPYQEAAQKGPDSPKGGEEEDMEMA